MKIYAWFKASYNVFMSFELFHIVSCYNHYKFIVLGLYALHKYKFMYNCEAQENNK